MKTNVGRLFRCFAFTLATLVAAVILSSCNNGSSDAWTSSPYGLAPPSGQDFEYNLNDLNLTVRLSVNEEMQGIVLIMKDARLCAANLLMENSGKFTLNSLVPECGDFTLNLQYVPVSGACQPGGLYLLSGSVTPPGNGVQLSYTDVTLAAWDQNGQPAQPWITPFDVPALLSQALEYHYSPDDPLNALGLWTYVTGHTSSVAPPAGCSLSTAVNLRLTAADGSLSPKVYQYLVTETNTGGTMQATVVPVTAGAPQVFMTRDESAWPVVAKRLSFTGLDALRDARVATSLQFTQSAQLVSPEVQFADDLRPLIYTDSGLDITAGQPAAPLAAHLARFFSALTASLTTTYPPSLIQPQILMQMEASLSTPLGGGLPPVVIPLRLVTPFFYKPGFDDNTNCSRLPNPGFCCTMAAELANAASAYGTPNPLASYLLNITFFDSNAQPLLRVQNAVVPISKVSP